MQSIQINKDRYYDDIYKAFDNDDRETFRELFLRLHERDQHELFHLLYPEKKKKIAQFLSAKEFAEIFEWMAVEDKEAVINNLPPVYIAEVFNNLANDDVVEFLTQSQATDAEKILDMMDQDERKRVQELMSYAQETAGSIMTKEYIAIQDSQTAEAVLDRLPTIADEAETIYYLYVLNEDGQLVGVLSLRDLLLAQEDESVRNIMFKNVTSVRIDMDQEEVAHVIRDYDLLAVPVVSHDGRMQGIVTVDDIMDIIEEEANEDFIEFAAIRPSDSEEKRLNPIQATKHRIPWILILLILGLLSGGVISYFEETLESVVILATFIPMIMGTAGNIGTQSLAVAINNLSGNKDEDGKKMLTVVRKEVVGGAIIGLFLALILVALSLIIYQNTVLAMIVSVAIFLTTILSSTVGSVIPLLFEEINIDPAVASGPFITTINDIASLLIYFSLAVSFLEHL